MKPQNLFIAKWSFAQELSQKLGVMVIGAMITIVLLVIIIVYQAMKPLPVYFIGSQSFSKVYPSVVSHEYAGLLAQSWLNNWENYTPATVEENRRYALKLASPRLLARMQQRVADDIRQIKENRVSSFLILQEQPKVSVIEKRYGVELVISKDTYSDSQLVSTQLLNVRLVLIATPISQSNPYGLVIDEIEQEEVK